MLKKIPVSQVRLGMHVHALDGPWLNHPFWKTKFVLDDPQDLVRLQASGVKECWIDTRLGLDVATAHDSEPSHVHAGGSTPTAATPPRRPAATIGEAGDGGPTLASPTRTMADEVHEASAICRRGREQVIRMFGEARLGRAIDPQECLPLVEEITSSVTRNPGALVSLARLKTRDDYTYMHSVAVCALMVALARQLGQDDDGCRVAGLAGLLHDLGKAMVPEEVLGKPGMLNPAELAIIRTHPERGHQMLAEGGGAGPEVLDVCLHHHERVDGNGYPHRLSGADLTLFARMGAVCDVYDAITSHRPYKNGWDPAESIARMASWKGHFDGEVFQTFVRSLGIYPTGSLVRLRSQQLAIVVDQNPHALITPMVKVFYSLKSQMPVSPRLVDLSRSDNADRIVGREPAELWSGLDLDAHWAGEASRRRHR